MAEHKHLFQVEGTTWACFGHDDACGLRAPACFTPKDDAVTEKGLIDLVLGGIDRSPFMAEHFTIVQVP